MRAPESRARPIGLRVFTLVVLGLVAPGIVILWAGVSVREELGVRAREHDRLLALAAAERVSAALSAGLEVVNTLATEGATNPAELERSVPRAYLHHHELFDGYFAFDGAGRLLGGDDSARQLDGEAIVAEARRLGRPGFTSAAARAGARELLALVPVGPANEPRLVVGALIGANSRRLPLLLAGGDAALELRDLEGRRLAGNAAGPGNDAFVQELVRSSTARAGVCRGCDEGRGAAWAVAPTGAAHWVVLSWQPLAQADAFPRRLGFEVGLATLTVFVLAGLFGWGATLSVTRPLRRLENSARCIAQGDLEAEIGAQPGDEVGALGQALEAMRVAVRANLARTEKLNAELEARVAERTRELQTLNEALSARGTERTQLIRKLLSAQEDERKRVARELHDETAQQLAALSIGLETAALANPGVSLAHLRELAASALGEVHRLILDLRPAVLDDLGLRSALEWCADRTLRAKGVTVRCEYSGLEGRLPWELETAVFRAAQEALNNIARHSKAETVLLQLQLHDGRLQLDVEDDGRGFELASIPPPGVNTRGLGLMGMRERVEVLGGTLTIDSTSGQGTHLRLEVPLPQERA